MAERIVGGALEPGLGQPADGQPWWEWLAGRARAMRAALLAYPDGALVVAGNRPTAAMLPTIEQQLGVLVEVGFTPRQALDAFLAVGAYVAGEAVDFQAEQRRPPVPLTACHALRPELDWGQLPHLAAAGFPSPEERFESGLSLLIGGLRVQLAARMPVAAASRSGPDPA
jgi:TetR/AcrR family tetracycline transcriptional repressor